MEITVIKTGGFAGVHERLGPVDTGELGEAGREVEAKVEEIGFFDLPSRLPIEREIRDGFNYEMRINAADRSHRVGYADGSEREARRPLDELVEMLIANGASFEDSPISREAS